MEPNDDNSNFTSNLEPISENPELEYFEKRTPGIAYKTRTTDWKLQSSKDYGFPSYRVRQVFDTAEFREDTGELKSVPDQNQTVESLMQTPRVQIEAVVTREAGNIHSVEFQRQKTAGTQTTLQRVLTFNREEATALQSFFQRLDTVDPQETPDNTQYLDANVLFSLTRNETTLLEILRENQELTARLVFEDPDLSRLRRLYERRESVEKFEALVKDDSAPESDYQDFFEKNKWLLGLSMDAHLLTSVDGEKLEQVTTGFSVSGAGKRVDALLKTAGVINSISFAEIKKPSTKLVEKAAYRGESWGPSHELGGAVVQVQQTIHKALETIGRSKLEVRDSAGAFTETVYAYAPRGYIVAGRLDEFINGSDTVEEYRFRSFESFRRSISGITILTYDEVLGRARAAVELDS